MKKIHVKTGEQVPRDLLQRVTGTYEPEPVREGLHRLEAANIAAAAHGVYDRIGRIQGVIQCIRISLESDTQQPARVIEATAWAAELAEMECEAALSALSDEVIDQLPEGGEK